MNDPRATTPRGGAAPTLVLCRQCIRYVYEGTTVCPHCGGDSHEISDHYREGGYLEIETIQRIARTVERRG
jgi:RNA polymerase subunit RPABC4/transcription elongation factor Spt4